MASLLGSDECERAQRFRFSDDRKHFVASHGIVRLLLSGYLNRQAAEIRFERDTYDKPWIAQEGHEQIEFSLSHSGGLALIAVARGHRVGVDLELIRPNIEVQAIAEQNFAAAERLALARLSGETQLRAFFTCWVRKEAYLKGLGLGLNVPLDSFDVSPAFDRERIPVRSLGADLPETWSLIKVAPGAGYVGALATPVPDSQVVGFSYHAAA
jgi:4'-phosphopantetheinyl transferase